MKKLLIAFCLLLTVKGFTQKPCEYSSNIIDSSGTYKATKEYLMYERNFGNSSDYIYFTLANTDGLPTLNVQIINKSDGFVKAKCFNVKSRIYFQLNNGKIITLKSIDKDDCGTMIQDQNKNNVRVVTGVFLFLKGNYEELKSSPLSLMRIKYGAETEDYVIKKTIHSELENLYYQPDTYFVNYLHCL